MPLVRFLTNRLMSSLISFLCKQSIPDTQCGFRLISKEALKDLKIFSSAYEIETEILMQGAKKGFPIYSVPIRTIYEDETSQINPLIDTLRFLKFLFKQLWISNR
jgi:polyprenyl-phospho-N-acetylgalactosaminyl synthase